MRSENTKDLSDEELKELQEKVAGMTDEELAEFRNSFEADEMGFVQEEGEAE
jgi:hypothetical protein